MKTTKIIMSLLIMTSIIITLITPVMALSINSSTQNEVINHVTGDDKGNFYVSGYINPGNYESLIRKYSGEGIKIWEKTFHKKSYMTFTDYNNKTIGGIGFTGSGTNTKLISAWLSDNGTIIKNVSVERNNYYNLKGMVMDNERNMYITGLTNPTVNSQIMKILSNGSIEWVITNDYGTKESAEGIIINDEGALLVTGYYNNGNNTEIYLKKIATNGTTIWTKNAGILTNTTTTSIIGIKIEYQNNKITILLSLNDGKPSASYKLWNYDNNGTLQESITENHVYNYTAQYYGGVGINKLTDNRMIVIGSESKGSTGNMGIFNHYYNPNLTLSKTEEWSNNLRNMIKSSAVSNNNILVLTQTEKIFVNYSDPESMTNLLTFSTYEPIIHIMDNETEVNETINKTVVGGIIWNSEYTNTVEGAEVTIICNSINKTTTSTNNGTYAVHYDTNNCTLGDTVYVTAIKGNLTGSTTATVNDYEFLTVYLAIADVLLTPEFGIITGIITIFASITIFFYTRRK